MPADRDELLRPFALADPREVEDVLSKGGFQNVRITRQVRQARFVSFADFWEPIRRAVVDLDPPTSACPMLHAPPSFETYRIAWRRSSRGMKS